MDLIETFRQALSDINDIESKLTELGRPNYHIQCMERKVANSFIKLKSLNQKHRVFGGLKEDLAEAKKEYEDVCHLVNEYKVQLENDATSGQKISDSPLNENQPE